MQRQQCDSGLRLTFRLLASVSCLCLSAMVAAPARGQVFTPADLPTAAPVPAQGPQFPRPWSLNMLICGQTLGDWCGWMTVVMVDVTGDGRDDLCGYYGYGQDASVRNPRIEFLCAPAEHSSGSGLSTERFSSTAIRVPALTQALSITMLQTSIQKLSAARKVHAVDIDIDGMADHLCVRMGDGINCVKFANGQFAASATLVQPSFSDAAGWNEPGYESTIGFPKLGGKRAVCGRGIAGIHCFRFNIATGAFDEPLEVVPAFADRYKWRLNPHYFETIRYVDVTGDKSDDICARGSDGILCATFNSTSNQFGVAKWWTSQFRDAWGWGAHGFYDSLVYVDLNNDARADICGRGHAGLWCGTANAQRELFVFAPRVPALPRINAQQNFGGPHNPLSPPAFAALLPFGVDLERDGLGTICEPRAVPYFHLSTNKVEIHCAKSTTTHGGPPTFSTLSKRTDGIPWDGSQVEFHLARLHNARQDWLCWIDRTATSNSPPLPRSVWCARLGS